MAGEQQEPCIWLTVLLPHCSGAQVLHGPWGSSSVLMYWDGFSQTGQRKTLPVGNFEVSLSFPFMVSNKWEVGPDLGRLLPSFLSDL